MTLKLILSVVGFDYFSASIVALLKHINEAIKYETFEVICLKL